MTFPAYCHWYIITNFLLIQLSSVGIIRLPKFEMSMAKTEANNKPVLAAEDVYIVTVCVPFLSPLFWIKCANLASMKEVLLLIDSYGRIYCLQVDRVAMLLHSYRFYRDAVVQQVYLCLRFCFHCYKRGYFPGI